MKKLFYTAIAVTGLFLSSSFNAQAQTWNIPPTGGTSPDFIGTTTANDVVINAGGTTSEKMRIGINGKVTLGLEYEYSLPRLIVQNKYGSSMYNPGLSASFIQNGASSTLGSIVPFAKVNILEKGPFLGEGLINGYKYINGAYKLYYSVSREGNTILGDHYGANGTMMLSVNGAAVIGDITVSKPAGYKLYVTDGILTEKVKVAVKTTTNWSDFVFDKSYKLMPLTEVEKFIDENKHLPDVPCAEEMVENGLDVATMDAKLLQKIEELTLYMIEIKKENELLKKSIEELLKINSKN